MKTACFALLALVSVASSAPPAANPNYLRPEELRGAPVVNTLHPVEPAQHVFPKAPTVPFLPMCIAEGYFRDPYSCRKFYHCTGLDAVPEAFYCERLDFIFDMRTNKCSYPPPGNHNC